MAQWNMAIYISYLLTVLCTIDELLIKPECRRLDRTVVATCLTPGVAGTL